MSRPQLQPGSRAGFTAWYENWGCNSTVITMALVFAAIGGAISFAVAQSRLGGRVTKLISAGGATVGLFGGGGLAYLFCRDIPPAKAKWASLGQGRTLGEAAASTPQTRTRLTPSRPSASPPTHTETQQPPNGVALLRPAHSQAASAFRPVTGGSPPRPRLPATPLQAAVPAKRAVWAPLPAAANPWAGQGHLQITDLMPIAMDLIARRQNQDRPIHLCMGATETTPISIDRLNSPLARIHSQINAKLTQERLRLDMVSRQLRPGAQEAADIYAAGILDLLMGQAPVGTQFQAVPQAAANGDVVFFLRGGARDAPSWALVFVDRAAERIECYDPMKFSPGDPTTLREDGLKAAYQHFFPGRPVNIVYPLSGKGDSLCADPYQTGAWALNLLELRLNSGAMFSQERVAQVQAQHASYNASGPDYITSQRRLYGDRAARLKNAPRPAVTVFPLCPAEHTPPLPMPPRKTGLEQKGAAESSVVAQTPTVARLPAVPAEVPARVESAWLNRRWDEHIWSDELATLGLDMLRRKKTQRPIVMCSAFRGYDPRVSMDEILDPTEQIFLRMHQLADQEVNLLHDPNRDLNENEQALAIGYALQLKNALAAPIAPRFNRPPAGTDLCFFLNIPGHWTYVYIDRAARRIEYYDSMFDAGDSDLIDRLLQNLCTWMAESDSTPYRVEKPLRARVQLGDAYECGIWVLALHELRINKDGMVTIDTDLPPHVRSQISPPLRSDEDFRAAPRRTQYGEQLAILQGQKQLNQLHQQTQLLWPLRAGGA